MTERPSRISKVLSANDVGDTGTHQAGILVPKRSRVLTFFPTLASGDKNPRCSLNFIDDWQDTWTFAFIYYNNQMFGGTRNEYRLTRMTDFFRRRTAKAGDSIILSRELPNTYRISIQRLPAKASTSGRIVLGTAWRVIDI